MGITCVLVWRSSGPAAGQRPFESLCTSVEGLRGGSKRRFVTSVNVLKPVQAAPGEPAASGGDVWLFSFSDCARQMCMVLRQQKQVIEANPQVVSILSQVGTHQARLALSVEGQQYQLGDFLVRVGSVVVKATGEARGITVQVEYTASSAPNCAPLLQEFAAVLQEATAMPGGRLELVDDSLLRDYALPPAFCRQHLAVQYTLMVTRVLAAA